MIEKTVEINRELAIKVLSVVDKGLCKGIGQPEEGKMCVEAAVNYAMGLPHGDNPSCVSHRVRALKIRLNDKNWSSNAARAKGMRRLAIAQLGTAGQINDIEFVKAVTQMTIKKIVPRAFRSAARLASKAMKAILEKWALKIEKEPTEKVCRLAAKVIRKENTADAAADAADAAAATAAANYAAYAADAAADAAAADAANYAAYAADAAADAAAAAAATAAANYAAAAADAAAAAANYAADAANYAAAAATAAANYAAAAANYAAYAAADRDKEMSFFAEEVVQILVAMKAQGTEWLDLTEVV
jgi:hypothetical protein